jgi:hypothetical protein
VLATVTAPERYSCCTTIWTYDVLMLSGHHWRRAFLLGSLALGFGLCALVGATHVGAAAVRATVTCDLHKDGRKLGTTYVTSLKVQHVTCVKAKRVVKAFNACRRANGGVKGHCVKRVLGYSCSETRGASISTQYSARASCKTGSRVVSFRYTQYT